MIIWGNCFWGEINEGNKREVQVVLVETRLSYGPLFLRLSFVSCYTEYIISKEVKLEMVSPPIQTMDALIIKNPQLRNGRPIIANTGTTVRAIAGLYKLGLGAEEIGTQLPHLSIAQIYAALTYYHLHTAEIETDIAADSEAQLQHISYR